MLQRQHPWQYRTADAKAVIGILQGRRGGGAALHRKMAWQFGVGARGVVEYRHFCGDDGISAKTCGVIYGGIPIGQAGAVGVGIQRQIHLGVFGMRIANAGAQLVIGKIQPRKCAGIGLVTKPGIHRIGTGIHRRLQGRQIAGRTHQLHVQVPVLENRHGVANVGDRH